MPALRLSLLTAALALSSACTTHLRPKPDLPADGPRLGLKAALVVPQGLDQNVDDLGSFKGVSGSYAVDTGQSLLPALQEVFGRLFQSVNLVNKADQAGNADVVITVKTLKLVHPRPGDSTARFDLRTVVTKADGVQVIDAAYNDEIEANANGGTPNSALIEPLTRGLSATFAKLSSDVRAQVASLLPPPTEATAVAEGEPPAAPEPDAAPATPPAAPPPVPPGAPATTVVQAPLAPSASGTGAGFLLGSGLVLFAGGYAAPAVLFNIGNVPGGTNGLAFIPLAGPLLAQLTNPFLRYDTTGLAMNIAASAGQVLGLVLAIAGVAKLPSGSSGGSTTARASLLHGEGWSVMPLVTANGIGVSVTN